MKLLLQGHQHNSTPCLAALCACTSAAPAAPQVSPCWSVASSTGLIAAQWAEAHGRALSEMCPQQSMYQCDTSSSGAPAPVCSQPHSLPSAAPWLHSAAAAVSLVWLEAAWLQSSALSLWGRASKGTKIAPAFRDSRAACYQLLNLHKV